jgi:RNA polymerase subunit RPABC4/transcription elongation factor Spt4
VDEFVYRCDANIEIRDSIGVVLGHKKCGNKFSNTIKTDYCPVCGQQELTLIPKAFLVLWDTDEMVRAYVTERMEVRSGLDPEAHETGRKIIAKYSGKETKKLEYVI